jgi:predicted enzyme related to lactoylglutathione lyase
MPVKPVIPRFAAVIFADDIERLATFYSAVAGLARADAGKGHVVVAGNGFELTLHAMPRGVPLSGPPYPARQDTCLKLCLPVKDLAASRQAAGANGGSLRPKTAEWEARGFRACDGVDPEGNVFQLRVPASVKPVKAARAVIRKAKR